MWYPFLCYLKQFSSVVPTNPFVSIFLQPLCRRQKSQLLWNHANPDSFRKTPGVGGAAKIASLESTTSRLFFRALFASQLLLLLCESFSGTSIRPCRSNLPNSFSLCVNSALSAPLRYPLSSFLPPFVLQRCESLVPQLSCFHIHTKPQGAPQVRHPWLPSPILPPTQISPNLPFTRSDVPTSATVRWQ